MDEVRTQLSRSEAEQWLAEHAITSVRVEGTNLDGTLIGKNVSVAKFLSGLESGFAFADIAAFGLDLGNVAYFGFAMPPWRTNMGDIFLRVDTTTLCVWEPGRASVIGDFWTADGKPLSACPRHALRRAMTGAGEQGYGIKVAVEMEATVFEESLQQARLRGYRDLTPLGGAAGACYVLAKSGDWDAYMRAVVARLDELAIPWEAWNDEAASGQVELNLAIGDPLTVADRWVRARQVMREVADRLGHSVTFMAKWCDEFGQASHLNLSLERDGANAFYAPDGPSELMTHFLGGVMASMPGTTSLAMPWITSYRRLVDLEGPPTTVSWGVGNKTTAIRAVVGHPAYSRIEYRVPGSDSNVYLVLAAVIGTGLAGVDQRREPPPPSDLMAWRLPAGAERLPRTMTTAAEALAGDKALSAALGQELIDYWIGTRRWEWLTYHRHGGGPDSDLTGWEARRYFELA
ncbi:MAG: glutamine synthetase [Hamadaea sp.]|uniref:Glutamine synthetase n=1 Tax=Glycomyces artemisiae TaxID=1076443 RepID=A0A850CAF1_9ACTN|nr:glutamine synthetase [Hamadaea sp.]NUQ88456.1 glutamine synthetase [Glycomyces artemisiae]NUT34492.1 glutamine synthetase [Hamadaea sp.]